jgi:hypothetical protein
MQKGKRTERGMEWYSIAKHPDHSSEEMLLESEVENNRDGARWPRPPSGHPIPKIGPSTPNVHKRKMS